jgi:hypothetical protein
MSRKSERKKVRKELVATYIRSNPREGYDEIAKKVNNAIAKLGDTGTFAELAKIDKKLRLPRGTSWEMGGYADYFVFEED